MVSSCSIDFPANRHFSRVEPRGFEPTPSAVQRRHNILLERAGACKIPANSNFLSRALSLVFRRFSRVAAPILWFASAQCPGRSLFAQPPRTPLCEFRVRSIPKVSSRCRRPQRAKRVRIAYPTARNARVSLKMALCDMHSALTGDMICSLVTGRRSPPFFLRLTKETCEEQDDERTDTINGRSTPTT